MNLKLFNLLLVSYFLLLKLLCERIDFLFLLVKDLILLLFTSLLFIFNHILRDIFNVLLICVNHFLSLNHLFVHLLDFGVILLDSILEPFSGFRQRQVHLVGLKLEIVFLFKEHLSLLFQMLGSLLESVLSQPGFGLSKSCIDFFKLVSGVIDFLSKNSVFLFQLLILISLLRIQIIQSRLVLEVNFLDLLLVVLDFSFHVSLFTEEVVQVRSLLVILTFDMHVKSLDIFRFRVTPVFIKS